MGDTEKGWISTLVTLLQTTVTKVMGWVDGLMTGKSNASWLWVVVGAVVALKVLPGIFSRRRR